VLPTDYTEIPNDGLRTNVTGRVEVTMQVWKANAIEPTIDAFMATYPGVAVEVRPYAGSEHTFIPVWAASNDLPDIIFAAQRNKSDYIAQSWIYPLDEFIADDDPCWAYFPQALKEWHNWDGRLWAIPTILYPDLVLVNLDALNALNMDLPPVDWSWDDYVNFVIRGTTAHYSGTLMWPSVGMIGASMTPNLHMWCFDIASSSYMLTRGFLPGLDVINRIRAVPGAAANSLRNAENDHEDLLRKFGDIDVNNQNAPTLTGQVLSRWVETGYSGWRAYPFNFTFLPTPQNPEVGLRPNLAGESSFMFPTARDKDAAFELLKWMSYGYKGQFVWLDHWEKNVDHTQGAARSYIFPATAHPFVMEKLMQNPTIQAHEEAIMYTYRNMGNAMQGNILANTLPGIIAVQDQVFNTLMSRIDAGEAANAVVAELDAVATGRFRELYNQFIMVDLPRALADLRLR
jgi:multiple sugar transport system substrate-binding protein